MVVAPTFDDLVQLPYIVLPVIESLDKLELLLKLIGKEKLCCPECSNYYTYHHEIYRN